MVLRRHDVTASGTIDQKRYFVSRSLAHFVGSRNAQDSETGCQDALERMHESQSRLR